MEEESQTTKHARDGNGNIVMPSSAEELNRSWVKRNIMAAITGAFALAFLITTSVFGIILNNSRAANNQLQEELNHIATHHDYAHEENKHCETCAQRLVYYYYEYRF